MFYTLPNKKTIEIKDAWLENTMKALELTKDEAIEMYLEDLDIEHMAMSEVDNDLTDEQKKNAKKMKNCAGDKTERKSNKPRTVKISDEKHQLFADLSDFLSEKGYDFNILKENKLFQVKVGEKSFKIDLIQERNKK